MRQPLPLLLFAAALWTTLVIVAPVAAPGLAAPVYLAASVVCHQLPDRSFTLGGAQLAVCARCLGLYAGGVAGFGLASLARRSTIDPRHARGLVLVSAVPTLVSVWAEWGAGWAIGNAARFAAALPLGAAAAAVVGLAVSSGAREVR